MRFFKNNPKLYSIGMRLRSNLLGKEVGPGEDFNLCFKNISPRIVIARLCEAISFCRE
jgi:hypothetical protein